MIHTKQTDTNQLSKRKPTKTFIGKLQPVSSRMPAIPDVNFAMGGSDFRTPGMHCTSSFGKQVLGFKHTNTQPNAAFSTNPRFGKSDSIGPGPCCLKPMSSLKKQQLSTRRSAESSNFGTSTRDGALKLYAVYTYKKI